MKSEDHIQLNHPDPGKIEPRILLTIYKAVKETHLNILPVEGSQFPFKELAREVSKQLASTELENLGSVGGYTTTDKLDLEARRLVERVPGLRPQHLRKVQS